MKNSPFILSLLLFLIIAFPNNSYGETKFKPGQTYSGFIQLDKASEDMQIPLPKGNWIVSGVKSNDPHSTGTILVDVYLHQAEEKMVKGLIKFRYAYENYTSGWRAPVKNCRNERNLVSKEEALYSGTQSDCWIIKASPIATNKEGGGRDQINALQKAGLKVPVVIPEVRYYRMDRDLILIVSYLKNPLFYGLDPATDSGSLTNDYSTSKINEFPKKKAFVDDLEKWATDWKKYTDLGFEGKLTSEIMGKPIAKKAEPKKESSGTGIEAKLKKLKSLVDKGLITPEDAAAKRKEILDNM